MGQTPEQTQALYDALAALAPTKPDALPLPSQEAERHELDAYITTSLSSAKTIIDSLPTSSSSTDSTRCPDWKAQNSGKDKPFELFKLSAKDGGANWWGRRSVVRGVRFERFKRGLRLEFGNGEGEGGRWEEEKGESVRGIGIERVVEGMEGETGKINVYHLKAQFPGPSAPRDFVTCCVSSHAPHPGDNPSTSPRHYTMISRPVRSHPETGDQKPGFVRGEYESIEFIRELPLDYHNPNNKVNNTLQVGETAGIAPIEWIMVTRSNPGGNVPRWMVERGTPGSIVADAEKFLKWVRSEKPELKTPRPSTDGERPVESIASLEGASESESTVILTPPEGTEAGDEDTPSNGEYSGVVGSLYETIKTGVEAVAGGVMHTIVPGQGEEKLEAPSRPSMQKRATTGESGRSFATAYSTTTPGRSMTPTSSVLSVNTEVVAQISAEEQKALEKHLENNEKIKSRADKALQSLAKEAQENKDKLTAVMAQSPNLTLEADPAQLESKNDDPPTKEQKKLIKNQWKLKERKKKLEEKRVYDLEREEKRYKKDVEKIKHRLMRQAEKDKEKKERELKKEEEREAKERQIAEQQLQQEKESELQSEVQTPTAEGSGGSTQSSFGGIDLAAAGKKMEDVMSRNGSIRSASRSIRRGKWANAREDELRNLVEQLTLEILNLRKDNMDLKDEVERLRQGGSDSGAEMGDSDVGRAKKGAGVAGEEEVPMVNSLV